MADEVFPFTFPISFEESAPPPTDVGTGTVQFRVIRRAQNEVDSDLYDLRPLREAFDRFASGATLSFIDADGTKLSKYPYGQRVEIQYSTDGGTTYTERFEGWVVDATRTTRDGLPQLDVDLVGHDHLLRRNTIEKDYSSTLRSDILEDIIKNFTPADWNGGNDVNVQVDETIDFPLRGVRPDSAIAQLASESSNEEFGVDGEFNFFFRQQSISRADPITDADIIDHDLPKSGKRSINRVRLYYGSNLDSVVVVEDRQAQKDLKDKLGTASNAVISTTDSRPEITSEDRAEAVAFEQLGERDVIQTGEITVPLGRFATEAGDVFRLTLGDAGISEKDFRVAQIDYRWQRGETVLTIARQEENNVDDLLVSLSDSLTNVKMRDADPAATETRFLGPVRSGIELTPTATIRTQEWSTSQAFLLGQDDLGEFGDLGARFVDRGTVSVESVAVTTRFLNAIREAWQTGAAVTVDEVSVGSDDSVATRADDALGAAITTADLDKFGAGGTTEFEFATVVPAGDVQAETTIREIGFGDPLYARVTIADTDLSGGETQLPVDLALAVSNDADAQGVITTAGQEATVDIIADGASDEPTTAVYGTGTTAAAESDTSLGAQTHSDTLDSEADKEPGVVQWRERTTSGEADTTNWSEFGLENASGDLLSRTVFQALPEDVVLELIAEWQASNA